ncbi:unnamed protein product [Fusarium langsethiae]|nr:unnamed protein product [Fusarium langsethiae]
MAACHFLQLRSSAPGLPGPYLLENHAVYQYLHELGATQPNLIMAIGGAAKRRWLADHAHLSIHYGEHEHSIAFACLQDDVFLLDCELHLQTDRALPRLKAGVAIEESRALLTCAARQTRHIAFCLYSDLLSHFSGMVLLFVSDFGGISQVIDFLCSWFGRAMAHDFPTLTRIILLHDTKLPPDGDVSFQLTASLVPYIRQLDPTSCSFSVLQIKDMVKRCFRLSNSTFQYGMQHMWVELNGLRLYRKRNAGNFSARHLQNLMQSAVQQFAREPSISFDAISASRIQYALPERIEESILSFLKCAGDAGKFDSILSSALVMDAYPPNMHNFLPGSVFDRLYKEVIMKCESALNLHGLVESVKYRFVAVATHNQRHGLDSAQVHEERIREYRPGGPGYCNFCIVQPPTHTLGCRHRLCGSCIVSRGLEVSRWHFRLETCPLCQELHQTVFAIKPPTAGDRVLVLGGGDAEGTWQFLKNLERTVGLKLVDLRGLFDEVRACGIGIFFAFAIFLEGWSLYDCKYHLARMRPKKFRRGTAIFGDKLAWNFEEIQRSNDITIVIDTGKGAWSNRQTNVAEARSPDVLVQYHGDIFSNSLFQTISSRLLASLFYIELDTMPDASRSSQYCAVMLQCRIPPGQPLIDFLCRLRREKTSFYYQGFGTNEMSEELCTESVLWECERHQPFLRTVILRILSVESEVHIAIDGLDGRKHWVSNCPYKIERLIRDQEMDCVFGRRDRKYMTETWMEAAQAEQDLIEALNNV